MADAVPIVLGLAVVAGAAAFRRLPARDAAVAVLVAGWAFLPNRVYPAGAFLGSPGTGGTVHALVIPADAVATKATAVGLACLVGAVLFRWPELRRVRWGLADLPMLAWCAVPLASALAGGLPLAGALSQVRYQVLAWGVPYLMGRAFLADSEGLARLAQGFVLAGLAYAPLCLAEIAFGPFWYGLVYGPHPYQLEGASRWLVSRPLVFLEHGNQWGLWQALAAVSAAWLWRFGRLPSYGGVPPWATAAILGAVALLGQSHGAIALAAAAAAPLALAGSIGRWSARGGRVKFFVAAGAVAVLASAALTAAVVSSDPGARSRVRSLFQEAGKSSFTWRLARAEQLAGAVAARPWLGAGRADWAPTPGGRFTNPVNLSLLVLAAGAFGAVGVAGLAGAVLAPAVAAPRRLGAAGALSGAGAMVALGAVLVMVTSADALMNSTWVVPVSAAVGGLRGWVQRRDRSRAEG